MFCLETQDLSYTFREGEKVLQEVNIRVPEKSIYGFLGPNGAGKTTTMRLLLGILRKQQGRIAIFGKEFDSSRAEILQKTGSLIESPSFYGHLTAAENLRVFQKVYQCPPDRIDHVLRLVGLDYTGKKLASKFSLGMKQRLGIAIALLPDPQLLVLDEPTNGLDPNGMIEVRQLLTRLNKENGITIFISSHLLAEIEKLATHIGVINRGRLMFQGTLEELKRRQQESVSVIFNTSDNQRAQELLMAAGVETFRDSEVGGVRMAALTAENIAKLNRYLVEQGVDVYGIQHIKNDLEAIFMELIK